MDSEHNKEDKAVIEIGSDLVRMDVLKALYSSGNPFRVSKTRSSS